MTSSNDRMALIDAEILRCQGAMEKVLVGEGVVLTRRYPNDHHSQTVDLSIVGRSGRKSSSSDDQAPDESWKKILTNVGIELGRMRPSSNVLLIYKMVIYHLQKAIPNITGCDISNDTNWKELYGYFENSRTFFQMITAALSVNPLGLEHIFEAIVKGLSFKSKDWDSKRTSQTRSQFLGVILNNIGENLKTIDQKTYDDVIGPGCGANMKNVYRILKGGESNDEPDNDSSGGWKDRLKRVIRIVDTLESSSVSRWIFDMVKNFMQEAVDKLGMLDLNKDKHWETVVNRLHGSVGMYYVASGIGGGAGVLFQGLHDELKKQMKGVEWNTIQGLDKRNAKIDSILKALGFYLDKVKANIYKEILEDDGYSKMKEIAAILMDKN